MGRSTAIIALLAGMLVGCSDPMYPQPQLAPIVLPSSLPPPPVDRSLLTIVLPISLSKVEDRPHAGRVRAKSQVNLQWIIPPESRQRDGKPDDAHFARTTYLVTVFVPEAGGIERVARLGAQLPEREVQSDGRWSYRLPLTAPDEPGRYVVRLHTSDESISESILEVVAGDANGH